MLEYLAIRLTHPENVHDQAWDNHYIDKIIQVLKEKGTITKATYGHEIAVKNKRHHFHYHLELELHEGKKLCGGISDYIKRNLKSKHELELPKGQYTIMNVTKTKEAKREPWFGYVLKDIKSYDDIYMIHQIGFTGNQLREMWSAAARQRELSIKQYQKYENKMNNDKEIRGKTWNWLDQQLPTHTLKDGDAPYLIAKKIVEYNRKYNDYKIPMDLKRRVVQYMAYRLEDNEDIDGLIVNLIKI